MGLFLSGDTPPGADCGCCCHCERRVSGNEYLSVYCDKGKKDMKLCEFFTLDSVSSIHNGKIIDKRSRI